MQRQRSPWGEAGAQSRDLYPAVGVVEGVTRDSSGKDSSGNCTLKNK